MDYGDIEREGRDMQRHSPLNREQELQDIERRTGADRALAEYLLSLEERIARLEREK